MALARDVMTKDPKTASEDWSLEQLARFFVDHSISGAPVVTPRGKVVGVVSVTDLVRAQSERESAPPEEHDFYARSFEADFSPEDLKDLRLVQESHRRVRDVMTPCVFDVNEDTPVAQIAEQMVRGRIHRVFVSREDKIVGVVSALDLLRLLVD